MTTSIPEASSKAHALASALVLLWVWMAMKLSCTVSQGPHKLFRN